jgi:diguanylate cyclase (GGDEF)-like protein
MRKKRMKAVAGRERESMGSKGAAASARRFRPPWMWLPVIFIAAALATLLLAANASSRISQNALQFQASQRVRLQDVQILIDDYFSHAIQLASAGEQTLAPVRSDDPAEAERIVAELFRSRQTPQIYGVGVFYAPGAFHGGTGPLFAVYDEAGPRGRMVQLVESRSEYPYTRYEWYKRVATTAPLHIVYVGPYWENGKSFISTLEPLYRNGRFVGAVTVDTLTATFKAQDMDPPLDPGDIAWLESSLHNGSWLLGTAPLPKNGRRVDQARQLRYTGAYVHLSTDVSALDAEKKRIVSGSALLAGAVWLVAALLGTVSIVARRSREKSVSLELDRARLESEIAIGKKVEMELRKAAYNDGLTGLPNRAAFLSRASDAIERVAHGDGRAVFFIDLDRFNIINETLGHLAGDDLLKMIAVRLRDVLAPEAWIARLGGDEFVVLASIEGSRAGALANRILVALQDPIGIGGRPVYTSASIGIVVLDATYRRPEDVLRDADIAMYEAKRLGRARYAVFDTAMRSRVAAESDLENDLRRAVERGEFLPYYQPIVDAQTQRAVSFEALARWQPPGGGLLEASQFIGHAERRGLVDAIDMAVLDDVCRDTHALFTHFPESTVAVNISARHLTAPGFATAIAASLRRHAVSPQRIKLEITETAIMSSTDEARSTLEALRGDGMQVVLDDFGAGHSSLAYLHRLPIAGLKIDRSFIAPLPGDANAVAIVRSIVALAHALGLYTVAEGVERADQLTALRDLGVAHAQGFLFSPAVALSAVLASARSTA